MKATYVYPVQDLMLLRSICLSSSRKARQIRQPFGAARGRRFAFGGRLGSPVRLAAAPHGRVQQERKVGGQSPDPHKGKHLDANVGLDVQLVLRGEGDLGGHADDRGDDGGDGEDHARQPADKGDEQAEPAGAHDKGGPQEKDEVENSARHEEAIHDFGSDPQEAQNGLDLGGKGDSGTGEELTDEDFDGIEPVECFGGRAMRDTAMFCFFFT